LQKKATVGEMEGESVRKRARELSGLFSLCFVSRAKWQLCEDEASTETVDTIHNEI